eukprot:39521-Eustigmatos_ZCMA.PRE.1
MHERRTKVCSGTCEGQGDIMVLNETQSAAGEPKVLISVTHRRRRAPAWAQPGEASCGSPEYR